MPVPETYVAASSDKIDAENDLSPFDWEIRTIAAVDLVIFGDDDDEAAESKLKVTVKPPVGANGTTFICNRTRERALSEALDSRNPNDWVGRQIAIRQGSSSFHGKVHKVVEVCTDAPKALAAKAAATAANTLQDGDEVPF